MQYKEYRFVPLADGTVDIFWGGSQELITNVADLGAAKAQVNEWLWAA